MDIKVLIIESSDIILSGLKHMLNGKHDITITKTVTRLKDISEAIKNSNHDVILLGPMIIDNLQDSFIDAMVSNYPESKIVIVEFHDDDNVICSKIKDAAFETA
jgi:DNA-binding NarL/FixJ family response regulator